MEAIHVETTVQTNGRVIVENLPFDEGDTVEITVREKERTPGEKTNPYPLRGAAYRYDDPFSPIVPLQDWEALK